MTTHRSDTHYTFTVNLIGAKHASRTFFLRGERTLHDLHKTICHAFRRPHGPIFSFYVPAVERAKFDPYPKEYVSEVMLQQPDPFAVHVPSNAATTTLDSLHLVEGQMFEYLFNFGDSSLHEIKVTAKWLVHAGLQTVAGIPQRSAQAE